MKSFAREFVAAVLVPIIIGFGGAWMGTQTKVAVLEERISGVKEFAAAGIVEAKQLAQNAHSRIDSFLLGDG